MKPSTCATPGSCVVGSTLWGVFFAAVLLAGCSSAPMLEAGEDTTSSMAMLSTEAPSPDPRVGLGAGLFDAEEALWNLTKLSTTPPAEDFIGVTNSDLAFKDNYVFQGNYNGVMIWDVSNPNAPELVVDYLCPASQSDVSVYGDLMFVSGEGTSGRLDCGTEGVEERVSEDRLRGIRIFDISDVRNPSTSTMCRPAVDRTRTRF